MSDQTLTDARLVALSELIDEHLAHQTGDHAAIMWQRVGKLAEEVGETVTALIGAQGSNPRKGYYAGYDDVADELLDVAITALGAYVHVVDSLTPLAALENKVAQVYDRFTEAGSLARGDTDD